MVLQEHQKMRVLPQGTIIGGKYEILKKIGQGGMSVVYLVMDTHLNKNWALKEVRKDGIKDYEVVKQGLIVETNMLKKLSHHSLPRIVDIIDQQGVFYVVMDFIEGQPLSEVLLEYGAQPQDIVIEWAKQLCDVLNYLHTRNPPIIYRDMKPANVMLKPEGNITLIDFGIAREFKEQNLADTTCLGTRGYAAPEQFGGRGQTDARTDIFCLGATLYHLVTGHNPSEPPYEMRPIRQWNPALSAGLERIILKCTQQNPDDRYQSCAELMYDLEHFDEIDDAYRAHQRKKLILFCLPVAACICSLAFSIFCYTQMKSEQRINYDMQLNAAAALAADSVVNQEFSPQIVEQYNQTIEIDPTREEAYIRLLDYCSNVSQTAVGLEQVGVMVDAGKGNIDENSDVLMKIARLYFGGNYKDESFSVSYEKAAKYFSMVDSKEYPEASYLAELSVALSSFSADIDWKNVVDTLKSFENYTQNQTLSVSNLRNKQLLAGVYTSNKREIMNVGTDPYAEAIKVLTDLLAEAEQLQMDVELGSVVAESEEIEQLQIEAMYSLATAYYTANTVDSPANDYDKAIECLQQLKTMQSDPEDIQETEFRIAEVYVQQGDMEKAMGAYEQLMKKYPNTSRAFTSSAMLAFQQNQLEESRRLYQQAAQKPDAAQDSNLKKLAAKLRNAGML